MSRYRKVEDFATLPLRQRQRWAQEFIDQAEQRMSRKRKQLYHRLVVSYVWRELNAGRTYVTESEVVRFVRGVAKRATGRRQRQPVAVT